MLHVAELSITVAYKRKHHLILPYGLWEQLGQLCFRLHSWGGSVPFVSHLPTGPSMLAEAWCSRGGKCRGTRKQTSLKLGFRWHAVTSAHLPVTEPSYVAWPNAKRLRSTVGWRGGRDKSMAAGSIETNDVIRHWPWFPPSDGYAPLHCPWDRAQTCHLTSVFSQKPSCALPAFTICLMFFLFFWILQSWNAGSLFPVPASSLPVIIYILLASPQFSL